MKRVTLTQYLIEQQRSAGTVSPELRLLLEVIARACKMISHAVGKGALAGIGDVVGTQNVQGEAQKKLDVVANEVLVEANEWGGQLAAMVSEEMDEPHLIPNRYPRGQFLLLMDPLDGSSNLDVNISVGTIFSVLRCPDGCTTIDEKAFLQPGSRQVAAGFTVYGASTILVLTVGGGVASFTLDKELGSFVLTHGALTIPPDTQEFAINVSNMRHWEAPVRRYIDECLAGKTGSREKDFNMRWVASMVADVYRTLSRGGIFMYPRDAKHKDGRLRLMYEANPMAFIVEQAGGAATNGRQRILDIQPEALHQRVGVVLGSKNEVERVTRYHVEEVTRGLLLGLALAALLAGEAAAQKDVADPLEHFLGTAAPGRAKRMLDDGVARTSGDFNNDGLPDLALWQEPDFGPHDGPVFLYLGRRDGRFAASGLIVVSAQRLFQPLPRGRGSAQLLVCEPDAKVAGGYAVDGFVVADLARDALPDACPAGDAPAVERLDVSRYRTNGLQAWIRR